MKQLVAIMLFVVATLVLGHAQNVFDAGEELRYNVSYNWKFIWIKAGTVRFSVSDSLIKGREYFFFDSYGKSLRRYDWVFKVRDSYRSMANRQGLKPFWYHRKTYEGGFSVNYQYNFDDGKRMVYCKTENSERPLQYDSLAWPENSFDLLTATYRTRNLEFKNMTVGDTVPIRVIIDRKFYNLYIRYLGLETIKNRDGKNYRCKKFSALLVAGTIFKGGEDLFVWVTDDRNKIPVQVEAKILIGSVKAWLNNYTGLKYPVECLITK